MKNDNPYAAYLENARRVQQTADTYEGLRQQRVNERRVSKVMQPIEFSASVVNGGHPTISTMTPAEAGAALAKLTEKIITDSGVKLTWSDWSVAANMAAEQRPDLAQAARPR